MPGIFAQTIAFAAGTTAVGMTDDMDKGIIDRFRSLPMARSAVLTGRTFADVVYNAGILVVLMVAGCVVGWRVHTGVAEFLAGFGLLLLFAYAMSWIGVWLGLNVPTVEVGAAGDLHRALPAHVHLECFVPPATLPSWLQPIAEWNPVSTLTAATRELWGNPNPYRRDRLSGEHPILVTLVWVVGVHRGLRPARGAQATARSAADEDPEPAAGRHWTGAGRPD